MAKHNTWNELKTALLQWRLNTQIKSNVSASFTVVQLLIPVELHGYCLNVPSVMLNSMSPIFLCHYTIEYKYRHSYIWCTIVTSNPYLVFGSVAPIFNFYIKKSDTINYFFKLRLSGLGSFSVKNQTHFQWPHVRVSGFCFCTCTRLQRCWRSTNWHQPALTFLHAGTNSDFPAAH